MIHPQQFTIAIVLMAIITFWVRYVFFANSFQITLTPQIKNILTFTAPCVLTAMFIPIMFQDGLALFAVGGGHGEATDVGEQGIAMVEQLVQSSSLLSVLLTSSYFWASVFAIIASLFIRNTLAVIIMSMLVFYGLRLLVFA